MRCIFAFLEVSERAEGQTGKLRGGEEWVDGGRMSGQTNARIFSAVVLLTLVVGRNSMIHSAKELVKLDNVIILRIEYPIAQ